LKSLKYELILYFTIIIAGILLMVGGISYYWTKKAVELRMSESTVETLKQIDKNMELVFGGIQDISLFVISNQDIRKYAKMNKEELQMAGDSLLNLSEAFANLTNSKSYVLSINVYGDKGLQFESAGVSWVNGNLIQEYENKIPSDGSYILTPTYKRTYQMLGECYVISMYRQLKDINNLSQRLGIIRIDVNEREINRVYRDIKLGNSGYVFIANKDGYILSHSDTGKLFKHIGNDPAFAASFSGKQGYYRKNIEGKDVLVTYYTSSDQNLVYIGVVPFDELTREAEISRRMMIVVILVGLILAFIIVSIASMKITEPINKLSRLMQKVEEGNMDVLVNINRKDEIGTLGRSFNSMTRKLKTLIEEVYVNKLSRKEAELKALQAHINPHFLYNTLDVIYWSSRLENAPKTGEIVSALAKLFKLGLNKGNEITTVEKEVEHLKSYLVIQKVRYDEEPDIVIDVDPALYGCSIIKLILQPLVENALIHGIADLRERKGKIRITGREYTGGILFEVTDNGVGMDETRIKEIFDGLVEDKKGYGVKNVDERIKLYFGEQYGVSIYSVKGEGTRVEVRVPKVMGKAGLTTND